MRELGLSRSSTATSETYDTRPRKIGASAAEAQQLSNRGCKVSNRGRKPKRLAYRGILGEPSPLLNHSRGILVELSSFRRLRASASTGSKIALYFLRHTHASPAPLYLRREAA
jgi:hypothetical protein